MLTFVVLADHVASVSLLFLQHVGGDSLVS